MSKREDFKTRRRLLFARIQSRRGYLDSPRLERRDIRRYSNVLESNFGISLEVMHKDSPVLQYMDENGMRAGFSSLHRKIYVRRAVTYYELVHEMKHAQHWANLGEQQYDRLSVLQKETYVFEELMNEKHNLTSKEVVDAYRYLNKLRADYGIDPLSSDVIMP
ncbi:zincin-like metallopeptidase toxin domain-containing protein [Hymenobacter fodinae]|uniref:Tox-MPTase4 domain-containing protein n=1 Tax=Hymenobacter fodinae TaxID=2510796 RepID=A0A4Z0NZ96_9BACT|nr:zincin-like metallopeptidase toxin domain-containing protein [Hymenobacter fodinae]TGE03327.1 hypothetical protein EU556_25770 [Hymenobacter fodinae]